MFHFSSYEIYYKYMKAAHDLTDRQIRIQWLIRRNNLKRSINFTPTNTAFIGLGDRNDYQIKLWN